MKPIWIILIIILVIGLIIGGIYWYNSSQKDKEKSAIIDQIIANHPNTDVTRETLMKLDIDKLKSMVPASVH